MQEEIPSDLITSDLLKKYRTLKYPKMDLRDGKVIPTGQEWHLCGLMHSKCNFPATMISWGEPYIGNLQEFCPLASTDADLIRNIARTFIVAQGQLEGTATSITKQEVAEAFANYYHLIKPDTEIALYIRHLIEEAFNVLELGSIPLPKYMNHLDAIKSNRKTDGYAPTH